MAILHTTGTDRFAGLARSVVRPMHVPAQAPHAAGTSVLRPSRTPTQLELPFRDTSTSRLGALSSRPMPLSDPV